MALWEGTTGSAEDSSPDLRRGCSTRLDWPTRASASVTARYPSVRLHLQAKRIEPATIDEAGLGAGASGLPRRLPLRGALRGGSPNARLMGVDRIERKLLAVGVAPEWWLRL